MALKLNVINFQSHKYSSFSLPPTASIRSPKFFMASAIGSQTNDAEWKESKGIRRGSSSCVQKRHVSTFRHPTAVRTFGFSRRPGFDTQSDGYIYSTFSIVWIAFSL